MCNCENGCEFCDEAFQEDMRQLRKEQLRADISPEEIEEELKEIEHQSFIHDLDTNDYWSDFEQ